MEMIISNLPDLGNNANNAILTSRIYNSINEMMTQHYQKEKSRISVHILTKEKATEKQTVKQKIDTSEEKTEEKSPIALHDPQFSFDQLVLEENVLEELKYAIDFQKVKGKVYEEWGLSKLEPSPKLALNFWGPSGTGKTMAAQALANVMGKKIILASYAEIESKYHGDGPKNVKRLFNFASESDAILFIDEADSLLSKRLTDVTQGSEQAINSMRSQLLIQIEQFTGIVIFATNLASNYDGAFITRIKSIQFKLPNKALRKQLWEKMLLPSLPLKNSIDFESLSTIEGICGRDIKNAIIKAAIKTAIDGGVYINQEILETAIKTIVESNNAVQRKNGNLSEQETTEVERKIKLQIHKDKIKKTRH
jgi:AAA+ superfamily predicted ATPase